MELTVSYGEVRKLIIYEVNTSLANFKTDLLQLFALKNPKESLMLMDSIKNAEITSEKSLREDRPITILVTPISPTNALNAVDLDTEGISYVDLLDRKFNEEDFLVELNKWALTHKFKLRIYEGLKSSKKGYKRTFKCSADKCPYKIMFRSPNPSTDFTVYKKLSKKYKKHDSKNFTFFK